MADIYGQLVSAQAENRTSTPGTLSAGLLWCRTDTNLLLFYDGGTTRTVVTLDQTQTLTNKSISASQVNSGQLAIANGGTNASTSQGAINNTSPLTTKGDVVTFDGTNTVRLAVGTDGFGLVADSAQTTGIKWTAIVTNPMATTGDMIYGGASGAVTKLATGTTAGVLHGGNGAVPSWSLIVNADVDAAAAITDGKLATISTAGKVSGGAITSGTIGGSTIINSTGTCSMGTFTSSTAGSSLVASTKAAVKANITATKESNSIFFGSGNSEYNGVIGGYANSGQSAIGTAFYWDSASANTVRRASGTNIPVNIRMDPSGGTINFEAGTAGTLDAQFTFTNYGQMGATGAWVFPNSVQTGFGLSASTTTGSSLVCHNTSTAGNPVAVFKNENTTSSSDSTEAIDVIKGSTTSTTSQRFMAFFINAGATSSGFVTANGANAATFTPSSSDVRLKKNIAPLSGSLDKVLALRPCEFDYKDGSGHQWGFIAQEMELVFPEDVCVFDEKNGYKTIAGWSKQMAHLVCAIQELKRELDELKGGKK